MENSLPEPKTLKKWAVTVKLYTNSPQGHYILEIKKSAGLSE